MTSEKGSWTTGWSPSGSGKDQVRGRRGTGQRGHRAVADHQASRGVAGAGDPGAGGRPPAVQADRDVDLIGARLPVERSGDEQVGEPAVEGHGGNDGDAGVSGRTVELAVELLHGRLLGGDVQVVGAVRDRGARERDRGVEERPGAVDHRAGAGDRPPQLVGVVEPDDAVVQGGVPRRGRGKSFGAAAGQHGREPASQQLVDDEAPGVTGCAVDQDRFGWVHGTIVRRTGRRDERLK